jgi:hypothetical protein
MGLDVTMFRCPNRKESKVAERAFTKEVNKLLKETFGPPKYGPNSIADMKEIVNLTTEQWETVAGPIGRLAQTFGIVDDGAYRCTDYGMIPKGSHKTVSWVSDESKLHPKHMYRLGYFRVDNYGFHLANKKNPGYQLTEIFRPPVNSKGDFLTEFRPNWKAALTRVNKVIDLWSGKPKSEDQQWWLEAFEIVRENVQHALASKKPTEFYLAWNY